MIRRLACALALVAVVPGCDSGPPSLALTLRADGAIDDAALARVTRLEAAVRGDESGALTVELAGRGLQREERVRFVPKAATRTVGIAFVARDAGGAQLAAGDTGLLTVAASGTTRATVFLTVDGQPPLDLGGLASDGGAADGGGGAVSFSTPAPVSVTEKPTAVAIANLLGSGPVIAVVRGGTPGITLLTRVASAGTWVVDRTLPIAQTSPRDIAVGRLDEDALDDLVVATNEGFSLVRSSSMVLSADRIDYAGPTGVTAMGGDGIAVGDLDNDGIDDVAVGGTTIDQFVWWKNVPRASSYLQQAGRDAMSDPVGLAIGNFDNFVGNDVAAALSGSNRVRVFYQLNGAFAGVDVGSGTRPTAIAAGDLDADGKPDLAVTIAGSNQVQILWGQDTMSFVTPLVLNVGQEPVAIALADVDGDGLLDVVTANKSGNSLSIARHGAARTLIVDSIALGREPAAVAAADLDGDNDVDLVVTFPNDNLVGILTNRRL